MLNGSNKLGMLAMEHNDKKSLNKVKNALEYALRIANLLNKTPIENWKLKTDLQSCFYEDALVYKKALEELENLKS